MSQSEYGAGPAPQCGLCPRLVDFRTRNQEKFPDFHNGAVPAFGPLDARLLIVGLAPGLKGANATGRPFTGDYAGDLLYPTLVKFGFACGNFDRRADDGLALTDCRIINAVRCVPPENKPTTEEVKTCRGFLQADIEAMAGLKRIIALGGIAHKAILATLGMKQSAYKFAHGAVHALPSDQTGGRALTLYDSYHCSRYNLNTGRLTEGMFHEVFTAVRSDLDGG